MNRRRRIVLASLAVVGGVALLWWHRPWVRKSEPVDPAAYAEDARHAHLPGDTVDRVVYLDQGWTPAESMDFYTRSQGSRLIPYAWFLALEQAGAEDLFRDAKNIRRFGYLPQQPCDANPDGLPVGFARDPDNDRGDWVGLTCAACHTTELHHQRVAYRIDGGPTLADFQTFVTDLTRALTATRDDPAKFRRFADRVLGRRASALRTIALRKRLDLVCQERAAFDARNATPHPYGYGRLDAFGHIVNQVLVVDLGVNDPAQVKPPDAPVSYPFLWDTPHHDFVQWNGIARNEVLGSRRLGGLVRNVGEVLGVFGEVHVSPKNTASIFTGYRSSVRVPDLIHLEEAVENLRSPRWPDTFPPIDAAKADAGRALYDQYCLRCHARIDRADPLRKVTAVKTPVSVVRTDPRMATNFADRVGQTGKVRGRREYFVTGNRFGDTARADALIVHTILGVVLNSPWKQYRGANFAEVRDDAAADRLVYKARPLNGIWATAPYLHNGSVPDLYQLLLPADRRPAEFFVGSREFDPVNVGLRSDPGPRRFRFRTTDEAGRPIPGNSNAGHEYGTGKPKADGGDGLPILTDDQRRQLVEYLKTL
jgi:hypothetical protein